MKIDLEEAHLTEVSIYFLLVLNILYLILCELFDFFVLVAVRLNDLHFNGNNIE